MEIDSVLLDRQAADAVWDRVFRTDEERRPSGTADSDSIGRLLSELIDEAARSAAMYSAIAARTARMRAAFISLAGEKRAAVRRLKTEYFVLTGQMYETSETKVRVNTLSAAMREQLIRERSLAETCVRASKSGDGAVPSELFSDMNAQAKRHAEVLSAALGRMIG